MKVCVKENRKNRKREKESESFATPKSFLKLLAPDGPFCTFVHFKICFFIHHLNLPLAFHGVFALGSFHTCNFSSRLSSFSDSFVFPHL